MGRPRSRARPPLRVARGLEPSRSLSACFSPDGKRILSGGDTLRL
jgi:hypothetical protein